MHLLSQRFRLLLTTTFGIALSGCMVGPDFHSPAAPPVKKYTESPLPTKTVSIKTKGSAGKAQQFVKNRDLPHDWWILFHSKELNRLISIGLANSPNLIAAQAALKQAEEAFNAQWGSSLFPALNASLDVTRQRFSGATFGTAGANTFTLYNPAFNITYTLDLFGGARRQLEALCAQVHYQWYELQAARITLTSNIATTAITAASLREQIKATRLLIKAQAQTLRIIRDQFRFGSISRTDVLTQETQLAQTQATLPILEKNLFQTKHLLAILIGDFPGEAKLPIINLNKLYLPAKLPLSLPSRLTKQRPDIQAADALLHAASAQIGVATANLFPQIPITGSYGWLSDTAANLISYPNSVWSLGTTITQPLFNAGSLMAKRRQAIAAYDQAFAQYRQTVLQAFQNVADILRAIETDARAFEAQKIAETAARQAWLLTRKQYLLGGTSYLYLLNAQRQYQQTIINRIQAQATRYTDTIALFQALGGGWWQLYDMGVQDAA